MSLQFDPARIRDVIDDWAAETRRHARSMADYAASKLFLLATILTLAAAICTWVAVNQLFVEAPTPQKVETKQATDAHRPTRVTAKQPAPLTERRVFLATMSALITLCLGAIAGHLAGSAFHHRVPRSDKDMKSEIGTFFDEAEPASPHDYATFIRKPEGVPYETAKRMLKRWARAHAENYEGAPWVCEGPSEVLVLLASAASACTAALVVVFFHGDGLKQDMSRAVSKLDIDLPLTGMLLMVAAAVFAIILLPISTMVASERIKQSSQEARRQMLGTIKSSRKNKSIPINLEGGLDSRDDERIATPKNGRAGGATLAARR
jgi:NADH:ubiquinone oxidoreductase subunit 5 (subunit L)/multisubunit Na+/H+ antiporter MnhA subunit